MVKTIQKLSVYPFWAYNVIGVYVTPWFCEAQRFVPLYVSTYGNKTHLTLLEIMNNVT